MGNASGTCGVRHCRIAACLILLGWIMAAGVALGQLSTTDHLEEPGFWPTQSNPTRADFRGDESCARCHAAKFASQKLTPMALSAMPVSEALIPRTHPQLSFATDKYQYRIATAGGKSVYTVSGESGTLTSPLLWAFGTGRVGQSFLFKKDDGNFYEARVTYFETLHNLEFTPTRALLSPKDIEEAMDRPVGEAEVSRCFSCHATGAVIGEHFDEAHLVPGVHCEACHGAGADHVAGMDLLVAGKAPPEKQTIFNSAHLSPVDAVDFCGSCHGTWWDVKLAGVKGVSSARSAPYRLVTSKCWGKGDARLTCTACHDPHEQLETRAAAYDAACLKCHVNVAGMKPTADHPGAACPVAKKECASCHMQKVYVPEMHDNFTDHRIRIVRAGEKFPE